VDGLWKLCKRRPEPGAKNAFSAGISKGGQLSTETLIQAEQNQYGPDPVFHISSAYTAAAVIRLLVLI
jgi:hypothetical protein